MNLIALIAAISGLLLLVVTVTLSNKINNRWLRYLAGALGITVSIAALGYFPVLLGDSDFETGAKAGGYFAYLGLAIVVVKWLFFRNRKEIKLLYKIISGIGILAVFVFFSAIGKFVDQPVVNNSHTETNEATLDAVLLKTASDMNAQLPMMVDSETQLDNVIGADNLFRYNYTLLKYSSSDISAQDIKSSMGEEIINITCTMQVFAKNGVTVSHAYYGNQGKLITIISVFPSQCNNS